MGGSAVPVKHVAGLVNVRRGKRVRANSRSRTRRKRGVGQIQEQVQYVGEKVFVNNEYIPEYFTLNVPGRPVYMRDSTGRIMAVKWDIAEQTYLAAEDVIPEVRDVLQEAFLRRANEQIGLLNGKTLAARKSRVEDRLSA